MASNKKEVRKRSRVTDRFIPAGAIAGVGIGLVSFGYTYNPFVIPGYTLVGLAIGFVLSIVLRKDERED